MSRNARLKNIASGLGGSFVSRNNDLGGYWSIGKLRSLAKQHGQTTVILDLLHCSMQPWSSEFDALSARYQRLLKKLAEASAIRAGDITAASITIDFAPEPVPRPSYIAPDSGDRFVMTVTITADERADGVVHYAGYCRPHDPASERQSNRTTNR